MPLAEPKGTQTHALDVRNADAVTVCLHQLSYAHAALGGVGSACVAFYPSPTARGTGLGELNHTIALLLRLTDFNESQERACGALRKTVVAIARHRPQCTSQATSLSDTDSSSSPGTPRRRFRR